MSSALDDDTRRTIAGGRETLGAALGTIQTHLQRVFIVFVLTLVGTIWLLRNYIWDILRQDLITEDAKVVFVTPFDVILLQVKIGLVVGIIVSIPVLLYLSRDELRARGYWPQSPVPRWKLAALAIGILTLFVLGVAYAYFLFFPIMFEFLINTATQSGFRPTYSIAPWVEFIVLLSLSFGLAAQLPLAMSVLAYTEIVPYETFRDKWKHAILGLYAGGAIFTPPDPITQLMWATPLVALYAFSLRFTKIVVTVRRSSEQLDLRGIARQNANVMAGSAVLAFLPVYLFLANGGVLLVNDLTAQLPGQFWPTLPALGTTLGVAQNTLAIGGGVLTGLLVVVVLYYRYVSAELGEFEPAGPAAASAGDPSDIDLRELDAMGVKAAPIEAFEDMSEDEALQIASEAMDADNPDKAQAVLDGWDDAQQILGSEPETPPESGAPAPDDYGTGQAASEDTGGRPEHLDDDVPYTEVDHGEEQRPPEAGPSPDADPGMPEGSPDVPEGQPDSGSDDAGVVTETTTGVIDAFTDEETTEEDIGGYYYDISFILESITSSAFWIAGIFMVTMGAVFMLLYQGGIRVIRDDFLARLPAGMDPEQVAPVALHPVEHLIFEIKFSLLVAIIVTLPVVLYFAWPALKDRGFAAGDRRVLGLWGISLIVGVIGGSIVGYTQVAPAVISWLAQDTIGANMVIAYRIKYIGWLVIYTTVGIGLLAEVPVTLLLAHYGGLIPFTVVWSRWREVTITIFAAAALLSPKGVFTMFVLAIPVALSFFGGLALLWVLTLGGRRSKEPAYKPWE